MPYDFNFDLSRISRSFFKEVARISSKRNVHKRIGEIARYLVEKFKISELTGLDLSNSIAVVEDLVDVNIRNILEEKRFLGAARRALFLPHCSRKYMDSRCKASFDPKIPSYYCNHCSSDCLINRATALAKKMGYDVYIIAGGSCIPRILKNSQYEGVVGVACCPELKLGSEHLESVGVPGQRVPLTKNGCANTNFNFESLERIL